MSIHRGRILRSVFGGRRRGGAVVEMAVVTPLLLTLVFSIIEYGYFLMIRQTVANACREGTRIAVLQNSTDSDVQTRFYAALAPTGLTSGSGGTLTIARTPSSSPTTATVTYSVPYSKVTLIGVAGALDNLTTNFFGGSAHFKKTGSLSLSCSMRIEGSS